MKIVSLVWLLFLACSIGVVGCGAYHYDQHTFWFTAKYTAVAAPLVACLYSAISAVHKLLK